MLEKKTTKPKKSKSEKETASTRKEKTAASQRLSDVVPVEAMGKELAELAQKEAVLISEEKLQEKIQALETLETIKNDRGDDVEFAGDAKDLFIAAFKHAYPVIGRALGSICDLGSFLLRVREALRPHKLYYAWLEYAGIPERTAANYVQVCERYKDRLPDLAHLGIKKLLTASRLKDCADYVEKNEQAIAEQSAAELEQAVKALRAVKRPTGSGRGRKPNYIEIGKSRIRPSMDGTKLVIEGITKKKQEEL